MAPARTHASARSDGTKRDAFVAAAVRVLAREGVASLTTRRIAEEANLPAGIFHYWFSSKADLLEAVLRATLDDAATAKSPDDAADDPTVVWKAAVRPEVDDDAGSQLGVYELIAMALRTPDLREIPRQFYQTYHDVARHELGAFVDDLNARGAQLDHAMVASLITGLVDGLVLAQLANPQSTPPPEEVIDFAFRILADTATGPQHTR